MQVETKQIHVDEGLVGLVSYNGKSRLIAECDLLVEDLVCFREMKVIGPAAAYSNIDGFIENLRERFTKLGVAYFSVDFIPSSNEECKSLDKRLGHINGKGRKYLKTVIRLWDYSVMH